MNKKRKPLELYVHIPFCIRKCAYCDFVSGPGTKAMQKEYEEALLAEIDAAEETAESEVISVFFGGGTPSAVDAGMLARVMEKLRSKYIFSASSRHWEGLRTASGQAPSSASCIVRTSVRNPSGVRYRDPCISPQFPIRIPCTT